MVIALWVLLSPHYTEITLGALPLIIIYLALGFWFGKITCSIHSKSSGFWLTVILFVSLNFIHSLIDGVLLISFSELYRNVALYSHELLRQPALYVVFWAMITPFVINTHKRAILSFISISGVWLIGMYLGKLLGAYVYTVNIPTLFFELFIFIFVGDIIHHLYDEFPNKGHIH